MKLNNFAAFAVYIQTAIFMEIMATKITKECIRELKALGENPRECLQKCILKKTGQINSDNEPNLKKYPVLFQEKAKDCADENIQENICDRITAFYKCYLRARREAISVQCADKTNTLIVAGTPDYEDKYACYHRCVLLKTGVINKWNEIKVYHHLKKSSYDVNAVNRCIQDNKQDDKCIQIIRRISCIKNESYRKNSTTNNQKI